MPPVARITATSRCFISSCVPSSVTVVIQLIAARRRAGAPRRLVHDLGDARDALHGRRVRAEDDRAARLERDQDLVDGGRRRVGRRNDGRDDAERLGDLDDPPIVVPRDDADGLHRPDELVDLLRAEQVLLNLVFDDAVAGFFDGEPREGFGLRRGRGGHRVDDGVDLLLAEFGELEPGLLGAARERARFGDRCEIAIGLRRACGFSHGLLGSLGQDPLDFGVRPRNDVDRDELADAPGRGGAGVGGRLDGADVAADHAR